MCVRKSRTTRQSANKQSEKKLKWIHIEEDHEQEYCIQETGIGVLKSVPTRIFRVLVPHLQQHREADRESGEAPHHVHQFRVGMRNLKRDHEQSDCEREHRVAEAFETG